IEAALLCLYGLGLLVVPDTASAFWPWKLDAFHAQTYSAIFITGGVGTWVLAGSAPREELLTLGAAQFVLALLAVVGLALTDSAVKRVDWSTVGTWAWVAIFAALMAAGALKLAAGLRAGRR